MRLSMATLFPTALILVHFFRATSAGAAITLTLSTFQPIDGFSDACTKAYNTPLADCSNSDFAGQGCSAKCIGFLDSLTNLLTTTCVGTSAYPNTLIGLFFTGQGAHTLCSNAAGSSSSSDGGNAYGQGDGQSGTPAVQSTVTGASPSTTSMSTSISTTITSTSTSISTSSTSSSTPIVAATSSTTTIVAITVTPESTTTRIAVVGVTVTPESSSDASTSTSHTKSSTSSSSTSTSTGNGNGGGTPLDIGSSASRDAAVSVWLLALIAGIAGVSWLL